MEKLNKQSFHNIQTIFAERTGINVCEKRYKETDEVIKEIPPERLLNAFYEMEKLAGMIVDEKI